MLVQQQRLKLSPQLYQSIQLMAMPMVDLRQRIADELEANPALELVKDSAVVSLEERQAPEPDSEGVRDDVGYDTSWEPPRGSGYDFEGRDNKHSFLEGAVSRSESLREHLIDQLRLQPVPPDVITVGELLINSLDANGFLLESPENVVPGEMHRHIPAAKTLVSQLDPIGTCVSDYRESLLVQVGCIEGAPPEAAAIISSYLELVQRQRFSELAKKLDSDEERVAQAVSVIKTLNPFPGRLFNAEPPRYIVPDLSIENRKGELVIVMNEEVIPVLGVNDLFSEVSKQGSRQEKAFANEYLRSANWFINSIELRNQTLFKVARAVVDYQREFFFRGPKYLRPLTLKDVADEIEVHETTVSRITSSKYVQTEWGVLELKYFFSNSISSTGSGSTYSKQGVKEVIRELLGEAGTERLSDQKISDLLEKRGIRLARRTVAKYRKELDIDSSYERQ